MTVEFRSFRPSDLPELKQMIFALYEEDPAGLPMTAQKIQQTVDELTRHPERGRILMFTVGPSMVGYAILVFYWSNEFSGDFITVDELYVKEPWRNQGIGSQFFEYLSADRSGKVKGLQLEVTPSNKRALAYYQKLNFQPSANTHLVKLL